jgi:branched-chain amino acid aminotransferase
LNPTLSINGRLTLPESAVVPALDRGLLYGDGVFEVLRSYNQQPFGLHEHIERLLASAQTLGMTVSVSATQWLTEVSETLAAAPPGDSHVRMVLTRGTTPPGLHPLEPRDSTRMVIVTAIGDIHQPLYQHGARAMTVRVPWLSAAGPLAGVKSLNYLPHVQWTTMARTHGFDEALIVALHDVVLEGASSNVFVVCEGVLLTPPVSLGILPGITRHFVLQCARELGIPIQETNITLQDLLGSQEVFVTSSVRELVSVVQIDNTTIGNGLPQTITRQLHRAYRLLTPAAQRSMPWNP